MCATTNKDRDYDKKYITDSDLATNQCGDYKYCRLEAQQEMYSLNSEENVNHVTNQFDVQSLGDKNEFISEHETQLDETDEANLQKYVRGCAKNPGHKGFVPVGTFSLKHLPEGHRDNDLYKLIKLASDLTVRVNVRMTSPDRPRVWPKTNVPYPFYNMKKSYYLRNGSGRMEAAKKFTDGVNKYGSLPWKNLRNCWCKKCEGSDSPSNVWWEFDVVTAAHLVLDEIEASHTTLRLFYDKEDSPVVSIDKIHVVHVNVEHDLCRLKCVTCDRNLADSLEKTWKYYCEVRRKVRNKYDTARDVAKLTFIVSHPHGFSKQVSIGQWKEKYLVNGSFHKFTYTTPTCPGSSGAKVYCVGYHTGWWSELVHSGSLKGGLNQSGAAWVSW